VAVSATFTAAATAQNTSEILLHFIEIAHDDLVTPLRFVNNKEDVVRDGNTYSGYNFEVSMPEDTPDSTPVCNVTIGNIDRQVLEAVESLSGMSEITVTLWEALQGTPDTTERGPYEFKLYDIDYDRRAVVGRMSYEDFLNDRYPADRMSPSNVPGLFG